MLRKKARFRGFADQLWCWLTQLYSSLLKVIHIPYWFCGQSCANAPPPSSDPCPPHLAPSPHPGGDISPHAKICRGSPENIEHVLKIEPFFLSHCHNPNSSPTLMQPNFSWVWHKYWFLLQYKLWVRGISCGCAEISCGCAEISYGCAEICCGCTKEL